MYLEDYVNEIILLEDIEIRKDLSFRKGAHFKKSSNSQFWFCLTPEKAIVYKKPQEVRTAVFDYEIEVIFSKGKVKFCI